MSRQLDIATIETIMNQLRSFYVTSISKYNNMPFTYFRANTKQLLDLARLALALNASNFTFEVPKTNPVKIKSLFNLIIENGKPGEWTKPDEVAEFEEIVNAFIAKGVDFSVMNIYEHTLPLTSFNRTIKIESSSFFQLMLNAHVFKNTFSVALAQTSDEQLRQLCFELTEISHNKMIISALSSEFCRKIGLFLVELAKRKIEIDTSTKQKFKTLLLILSEVTENTLQKPEIVENRSKSTLRFPFQKQLINLYELLRSNTSLFNFFSNDPLFIICLKKRNILPWLKDNATLMPWDFFSEIMLQTYSSEKFSQTFIHLTHIGLAHHLIKLREFSIQSSDESWPLFSNRLTRFHPLTETTVYEIQTPSVPLTKVDGDLKLILSGYRYHSILGRTLIFSNGCDYLAIKMQKKDEPLAILEKEYAAMMLFSQSSGRLPLQSDIPEAQGIYLLKNEAIENLLRKANEAMLQNLFALTSLNIEYSSDQQIHCLLYKVKDYRYFNYLHNPTITPENFVNANQKIIRDLIVSLKEGIVFDQLADIFHTHSHKETRTDLGRYLVLVALLRRHHGIHLTHSSGRVDRWQEAIRYVNLRETGLADLGDYCTSQFFYEKKWFQEVNQAYSSPEDMFSGACVKYTDADSHFKTLINANIIAEYLFILTLVCGKRAFGLITADPSLSKEAQYTIWLTMAEQMLNNSALIISLLTVISPEQAKHYLLSFICINRLAKQMQYWMTADYAMDFTEEKAVYQKKLSELYDTDAKIIFDAKKETSPGRKNLCLPGIGFTADGENQDLGAFNAQNPMKEDNKLYYMTPAFIGLLNNWATNFRNSFERFEASLAAKDFTLSIAAINQMKLYTYPHSNWQKKCTTFCYAKLLRASHAVSLFSHSPVHEERKAAVNFPLIQ